MMRWDSDLLNDEATGTGAKRLLAYDSRLHTLHDFEERFCLEDEGMIRPDERFRWSMLTEELNYRLF